MPGITNLPVASITRALAEDFRFLPMAAILPLRRSTSVFGRVPCVTVSTVALRISVSVWACAVNVKMPRIITKTISRFIVYSQRVFLTQRRKGAKKSIGSRGCERSWLHTNDHDAPADLVVPERPGKRRFLCLVFDVHRHGEAHLARVRRRRSVRDLSRSERARDRSGDALALLLQR